MSSRRRWGAVVALLALAGCSEGGDEGAARRPPPSAAPAGGTGAGRGESCPVTVAEVNEVVGTSLAAAQGCTFLDPDPAGTGVTLVQVQAAAFDGAAETVQSLRSTLAAEFEVEDVAGVGDAAFSLQRPGTEVVALVVFEGASQVKITLGTAQPRADAVTTLRRLYQLTRA